MAWIGLAHASAMQHPKATRSAAPVASTSATDAAPEDQDVTGAPSGLPTAAPAAVAPAMPQPDPEEAPTMAAPLAARAGKAVKMPPPAPGEGIPEAPLGTGLGSFSGG